MEIDDFAQKLQILNKMFPKNSQNFLILFKKQAF